MQEIIAKKIIPDTEVENLLGSFLDDSSFDTLVQEDTIVYKENGDILLVFKKNIIKPDYAIAAYNSLYKAAQRSDNRGIAAGLPDPNLPDNKNMVKVSKFRVRRVMENGQLSRTSYANPVNSGVVGYMDKEPRFPFCRLTAFTQSNLKQFQKAMPFIKSIDKAFETLVPERHQKQREWAEKTNPDFVIKGTAFTTVTVNRDWQTAVHTDKGDLEEGFGNLSVVEKGHYEGGYTVFPQYRLAFDCRTCDVALMDVHELHGNTKIVKKTKDSHRLSFVCYYRRNMIKCNSHEEEVKEAQKILTNRL